MSLYVAFLLLLPTASLLRNKLLWITLPLPVVVLSGYFIIGRVTARIMKPIRKITDTANNISHEDLSLRVQEENVNEEDLCRLIEAFNAMVSRLADSFEYIKDSSSYIAHELKTPIAIIKGESEFALKKERDTEEYKRVIGVSIEETKRMLKIIADLLLLTKMNYQPDVLDFEPVDMAQFVQIISEQTKILCSGKKITVDLDIPEATGIVEADESHLRRLFLNLIDNAVKFTPAGGTIGIRVRYEKQRAFVSISDTGMGIAEEYLPRLFEKFFRIDEKIQSSSSGSGLGLSIAQSIALLHKGEISVASRIGHGSCFTVSLPLKRLP